MNMLLLLRCRCYLRMRNIVRDCEGCVGRGWTLLERWEQQGRLLEAEKSESDKGA